MKLFFSSLILASSLYSSSLMAKLKISEGYVREHPPMMSMTAGFGSLTNAGNATITIVGLESKVGKAELHESKETADGSISMQELSQIAIKPGETFELKPMGSHIMLSKITTPLRSGESVDITFILSDKTKQTLSFPIKKD